MLLTLIVFILVLGFLVLIHELGHFIVAKRLGIGVEEFGFGFPPTLLKKRIGETEYKLNLLPVGGYVKIMGEDGDNTAANPKNFLFRPIWQRVAVVAAGVLMNIAAGWLLLVILFMVGAPAQITDRTPEKYIVSRSVAVDSIIADSPASRAGMAPGDEILSISGTKVAKSEEVKNAIQAREGEELTLEYRRNQEILTAVATAEIKEGKPIIGFGLVDAGVLRYPPHRAIVAGSSAAYYYNNRILTIFGDIIASIWRGGNAAENVGGPVAIAVATGDMLKLGLSYMLIFVAVLSFNLAIINILPFPALDGGRLVFLLIEKVRGKPSHQDIEGWFHRIGFALLMVLALVVTYRDIMRFGGRIWQAMIG